MSERILSTRPRVIPNWQLPEPASAPVPEQAQEALGESAVLSGSNETEAQIVAILQEFSYQAYETNLNQATA